MADCKKCIHEKVCQAWINHGNILYDDFEYSTEGCLTFEPTVVRCKDCTSWCQEKIARLYGVDRFCTMTGMSTNADDFCSYGERREGE